MTTMFATASIAPLTAPSSPTPIQQSMPQPYMSLALHTPPSSGEATSSTSPVSPRALHNVPPHLQMQSRQIRAPKVPMYVPAVLRPTEKRQRASPPKYGSPGAREDGIMEQRPIPELTRIVTEECPDETFGPVGGLPSRNHWKPDTASPKCDDATCHRDFTFMNRRHHCRRCGRIYCAPHSARYVPLDQYARFHPSASTFRACDSCWNDFKAWNMARVSRSNSTNSRDSTTPGTPIPGSSKKDRDANDTKAPVMPASFSGNWNWSTF